MTIPASEGPSELDLTVADELERLFNTVYPEPGDWIPDGDVLLATALLVRVAELRREARAGGIETDLATDR